MIEKETHLFARVSGHLQKEEARVALRQEVVGRVVLVEDLQHEVAAAEVCDGAREARAPPDEAQEERALRVGELLHHLPEPRDERRARVHAFVRRHRLEQVQGDVRAAAHLREKKFSVKWKLVQ